MKFFLLMLCLSAGMLISNEFVLETPIYSGSGCEAGTSEFFLSSGGRQVYLETPHFESTAQRPKSCMVVLPVRAAENRSVAIESVRVRLRSELPDNASGVFQAEMFLAGLRGPSQMFVLDGPYRNEESFVLAPERKDQIWSGCGQSANLRLNTHLVASEGSMQVISLRLRLITKPC